MTSPPTNPATTSTIESISRRIVLPEMLAGAGFGRTDNNAPRGAVSGLGNRHRQHAILQIGGHARDIDALRQPEGA